MLEFKTIQTLKPNTEILEVIKDYKYKIKNGKVKNLLHTNLQVIEPTEYLITYPITLTILKRQMDFLGYRDYSNLIIRQINQIKNILNDC